MVNHVVLTIFVLITPAGHTMNRIVNIRYFIVLLLLLCSCCNKPDPHVPVTPTDVYAGDHQNGFGVYWVDEGENALGFKVYRSVNSLEDFVNYADVPFATHFHYIDNDISGSNYYVYRVSAYNTLGKSELSKSALVPKTPLKPQAIIEDTLISISWEIPPDSHAHGIQVERSIDDTVNYQEVKRVNLPSKSFSDENISQGNEYFYRIRSYGEQLASQTGESLPSKAIGPLRANMGESGVFTDKRDRKEYQFIKIGKQVWMAENLNFETNKGSWCYQKTSANCILYGRLYDWQTANSDQGNGRDICPAGWHLPTDDEWKQLERQLGMPEEDIEKEKYRRGGELGRKLKTEAGWSEKNSILPAGRTARK